MCCSWLYTSSSPGTVSTEPLYTYHCSWNIPHRLYIAPLVFQEQSVIIHAVFFALPRTVYGVLVRWIHCSQDFQQCSWFLCILAPDQCSVIPVSIYTTSGTVFAVLSRSISVFLEQSLSFLLPNSLFSERYAPFSSSHYIAPQNGFYCLQFRYYVSLHRSCGVVCIVPGVFEAVPGTQPHCSQNNDYCPSM